MAGADHSDGAASARDSTRPGGRDRGTAGIASDAIPDRRRGGCDDPQCQDMNQMIDRQCNVATNPPSQMKLSKTKKTT